MTITHPRMITGGAVALSVATAVGLRNLRHRQEVPEHSETHLSVSCADGRYAQARAVEAMRLRPHWWGPEPRTVFPQTPPGGGGALLHPVFGPAVLDAIALLRQVHHFDLVELRFHSGGPGGCGYLNNMAAGGRPLWFGATPPSGAEDLRWSAFDVATKDDVLRIGELARHVVESRFADEPLQVRLRLDEFAHNVAGLPTVRTIAMY